MTPILITTPSDAPSAAIRSRRERELSRLALAKARWKRRLTGLDVRPDAPRAMPAK
jgi:hypothetical protein